MDAHPLLDLGKDFCRTITLAEARKVNSVTVGMLSDNSGRTMRMSTFVKLRGYGEYVSLKFWGELGQEDMSKEIAQAEEVRASVVRRITEFINEYSKPEQTEMGIAARKHFFKFLSHRVKMGVNINTWSTLDALLEEYEESIS